MTVTVRDQSSECACQGGEIFIGMKRDSMIASSGKSVRESSTSTSQARVRDGGAWGMGSLRIGDALARENARPTTILKNNAKDYKTLHMRLIRKLFWRKGLTWAAR